MNLSTLTSRVTSLWPWKSASETVVIEAATPGELLQSGLISTRELSAWIAENAGELGISADLSAADIELSLENRGYGTGFRASEAQAAGRPRNAFETMEESFTQADIELALDDRGWIIGGKRNMGELDPLARKVQVNRSRYYWLRDPLAKQAVRLWTDYSLGDTALSYECDDEAVQTKLDKFMKDRRNRRYTSRAGQRRLSQRMLVDGEQFFAIYEDGTIKTFDCLQMELVTAPDDEDTVIAFKRTTTPTTGAAKTLYYRPWDLPEKVKSVISPDTKEPIKFEQKVTMYFAPFDAMDKRGNGLLSCCSDWAKEHRRFMIARVGLTQSLSKFAFKMTVKGGQKQVSAQRAKTESTFVQTGLNGGPERHPAQAPGATFIGNEGVSLEAMPRTTGAGEASEDARGLKLMVCAGTGIPDHYFGDGDHGNLATATAMELPTMKQFQSYQVFWRDIWRDLFSIVLKESPEAPLADITVELPAILEEDLTALAAFLTSVTTIFPEAKVPALLKQALNSANVPNLDEVMKEIEKQKEENDQAAADLLAQGVTPGADGKPAPPVVQPAKPGAPVKPGTKPAPKPAAKTTTEAERMDKLTAALNSLVEVMK